MPLCYLFLYSPNIQGEPARSRHFAKWYNLRDRGDEIRAYSYKRFAVMEAFSLKCNKGIIKQGDIYSVGEKEGQESFYGEIKMWAAFWDLMGVS